MTTPTRKVRLKDGMLAESLKTKAAPGVVIPLVKEHMLANYVPDRERRWDIIHPSEMAKEDWCHRATYNRIYNNVPPELEKFDFVQQNIFGEGNGIHTKWQTWLQDTGKLWGEWHCLVCNDGCTGLVPASVPGDCLRDGGHLWHYAEIPLGGAHTDFKYIAGHADGAADFTRVEFKSVGLGTVRMDAPDILYKYQDGRNTDLQGLWRAIQKPLKSHLRQGDIYLWLAEQMGYSFTQMAYVYEFKPTQQVKEFLVKPSTRRIQPLLDKADEITYALQRAGYNPPECVHGGCGQCNVETSRKKRRVVKQ
jgi:hypothetical protein